MTPHHATVPDVRPAQPERRPELLAPAGDWECARAAVENGADAIYFGLDKFNARMRAHNFTAEDLPELMAWLHLRGVRGYVTFNTLVFSSEIDSARDYLRRIISAGVDAAIVQDVGICRLIRSLSPDFPIHASTQMTITSAAGVEFARSLGCDLVVLARECSLRELEQIQKANPTGMPLEVFVHGALCVAYSGQCLTSESLGGRSANRGECAQACRMPYELVRDGETVPLGDRRYLLSPQDLFGLELVPELVKVGVRSLKIEGRLKTPEYVAAVTRTYRAAIDRSAASGAVEISPEDRYTLEMAFSRGLYTGWFRGIDNQRLAHGRFGTKRGAFVGEVLQVLPQQESVLIATSIAVKAGDGLVFDRGRHDEGEQGGRCFQVENRHHCLLVRFLRAAVDFRKISPGDKVWKTSDPELTRALRATFEGEQVRRTQPLDAHCHGELGGPLIAELSDLEGHCVRIESTSPLVRAERQPLTEERLREQLGRLGGTPFHIRKLSLGLPRDTTLPISELNRMRRAAVDRLVELRRTPKRWSLQDAPLPRLPELPDRPVELIAVIRRPEQLAAAWDAGCRTVYCEFENPKRYRDVVAEFRSLRSRAGLRVEEASVFVLPPRIFKSGEEWILEQVLSCEADGWIVRNPDHLQFFKDRRCRGDFSLNVANPIAAAVIIERFQLERITASYDLNQRQLLDLVSNCPAGWFDVTLHQHMPMFHMEHCVFCAFLSSGKDYRDCGRPCEKHQVSLRDRVGAEHPLKADAGCRNTVYNSRAQTGAEACRALIDAGVRSFRIEFLEETPAEVRDCLRRYFELIEGRITGAELWRSLRLINQLGVTRGQLEGFGAATGNARQE